MVIQFLNIQIKIKHIYRFKNCFDKTLQVTTSSIDAIETLTNLEETNPYLVKQKALG